jgi:hypothetical protein
VVVCEPSAAHTPWRGVHRRDVAIISAVLEASSWSWHCVDDGVWRSFKDCDGL